jgi:peptide/nickel transport system permease protein
MLGDALATDEQREILTREMGLDRPAPERFFHFIASAASGEFGMSFHHRRPVADVILERVPATIELTVAAMLIALLVGIPLGVLAAVRRDGPIDRLATGLALLADPLVRRRSLPRYRCWPRDGASYRRADQSGGNQLHNPPVS